MASEIATLLQSLGLEVVCDLPLDHGNVRELDGRDAGWMAFLLLIQDLLVLTTPLLNNVVCIFTLSTFIE